MTEKQKQIAVNVLREQARLYRRRGAQIRELKPFPWWKVDANECGNMSRACFAAARELEKSR